MCVHNLITAAPLHIMYSKRICMCVLMYAWFHITLLQYNPLLYTCTLPCYGIMQVHIHVCTYMLPYVYKFLWDFIFENFANQWAFAKIKMRKFVHIRYKFAAAGRHLQN